MLNHYETVFMITPALSAEQVKDTVNKFKNILINQGATILFEEDWGLRKLAYPIQKKENAYYFLFEFKAAGNAIKILDTEYRRDESIIRHLTIALDKYAAEWAEKRRSRGGLVPPPIISFEVKEKEERQIKERNKETRVQENVS